jgi:succinate-semialdehyde dehydrogenase/glutarate-semialdehyde dehydrogenase
MSIQSINPATEELIETFVPFTHEQIDEALEQARQAFLQWRTTSLSERSPYLHRVASYLRAHPPVKSLDRDGVLLYTISNHW